MKKLFTFTTILIAIMLFSPSWAEDFSKKQEERIKEIAIQAILENPEAIEEAINRLKQLQEQRKLALTKQTIEQRKLEFERDPNAPVLGNPEGDVTVVEFFDYNCPYCKKAMEPVKELLERDKNIRLVYREWPILGEGSVFAARAALAARKQGKYEEMHWALMSGPRATESSTMEIAKRLGLDIEQLRVDMDGPKVRSHIELSMDLAKGLGINGTPTFLIGDQLAPGLISLDRMLSMVADARKGASE